MKNIQRPELFVGMELTFFLSLGDNRGCGFPVSSKPFRFWVWYSISSLQDVEIGVLGLGQCRLQTVSHEVCVCGKGVSHAWGYFLFYFQSQERPSQARHVSRFPFPKFSLATLKVFSCPNG